MDFGGSVGYGRGLVGTPRRRAEVDGAAVLGGGGRREVRQYTVVMWHDALANAPGRRDAGPLGPQRLPEKRKRALSTLTRVRQCPVRRRV